jgi:ribosomal protein S26
MVSQWNLRFEYVVSCVSHAVVVEMRDKREKKSTKTLTTKTWYLGRVYRMHHEISNMWIEYRHRIDL